MPPAADPCLHSSPRQQSDGVKSLGVLMMKVSQAGQDLQTTQFCPASHRFAHPPHITALMVTRDRAELAMRAVACFLAQSWPKADLVIVDDGPDSPLQQRIGQLSDSDRSRITYIHLPDDRLALGLLRNIAVQHARGELVCQWDDDDLYHPQRLRWQMASLREAQADACALWRHQLLWVHSRRLCFSIRRLWEGSLLCRKDRLPSYPELRRGEDQPVTAYIAQHHRFVLLDAPQLYTYMVHGANTFDAPHFEAHWTYATERFVGQSFERELRRIARDMPQQVKRCLMELQAAPPACDLRA